MNTILSRARRNPNVAVVFISLMAKDAKHFFTWLQAIDSLSFDHSMFISFTHLLTWSIKVFKFFLHVVHSVMTILLQRYKQFLCPLPFHSSFFSFLCERCALLCRDLRLTSSVFLNHCPLSTELATSASVASRLALETSILTLSSFGVKVILTSLNGFWRAFCLWSILENFSKSWCWFFLNVS